MGASGVFGRQRLEDTTDSSVEQSLEVDVLGTAIEAFVTAQAMTRESSDAPRPTTRRYELSVNILFFGRRW
jgi:hypothetical protein